MSLSRTRQIGLLVASLSCAAAPAAHAQFYHLSGRVTDSSGSGIWNVDLDAEDALTGAPLDIANDNTDIDGFYDIILPAGLFHIDYEAPPGLKVVSQTLRNVDMQTDRVIDVTLEDGFYLSGRVTDPGGAGVSQVDIDVDDPTTGLRINTPRDNTDLNGDYQVIVPPGTFDVSFEPPPGVRLVALEVQEQTFTDDTVLNAMLEVGFFLTGRVIDERGAGVADVDLDVEDPATEETIPTPRDQTDGAGNFSIVVPAGTFDVVFDPLMREDLAAARVESLVVVGDTNMGTTTLLDGVLLSGDVTDSRGQPVVNADLDVLVPGIPGSIPTPHDQTDSTGHYRVTVPPDVYDLIMTPPPGAGLAVGERAGVSILSNTVVDFVLEDAVSIGAGGQDTPVPRGFALGQNYPNPFNPVTTIRFELPPPAGQGLTPGTGGPGSADRRARLEIFDARGRRIRLLVDRAAVPGVHEVAWDGRDDRGGPVASGLYFYRLRYGPYRAVRKMMLSQ